MLLQACSAAGVCVNWRNNDVCPVMCEALNPGFGIVIGPELGTSSGSGSGSGDEEICEWRYEACGNPCPATCDNPNPTSCPWQRLEGCYARCKLSACLISLQQHYGS